MYLVQCQRKTKIIHISSSTFYNLIDTGTERFMILRFRIVLQFLFNVLTTIRNKLLLHAWVLILNWLGKSILSTKTNLQRKL